VEPGLTLVLARKCKLMGREGCQPTHQVALAQGQAGAVNSGTGLSGGKHQRFPRSKALIGKAAARTCEAS